MNIHVLGIGGTFMGSLAILAKEHGHYVSGSDEHIYPPMSSQLENLGIKLYEGYRTDDFNPNDTLIVGNVIKRGNPILEHAINKKLPLISGPQWLAENILQDYHVIAVAGTHGKTTTASLLAWILEYASLQPGFLIGGIPNNFNISARLGEKPFFVIEADEYDTSLFDKRSKFIHYRPTTLILNNLEFDHGDIFNNIEDIKRQFHHLIRTLPKNGLIINNAQDENLVDVLAMECHTQVEEFMAPDAWNVKNILAAGCKFDLYLKD